MIPPIVEPGPIPPAGGGNVVDPIPEPSTYALMLLGLAAIGVLAHRRRQRT